MALGSLAVYYRGKIGTLVLAGLFVAAMSFFVLTLTEPHFKSTSDLLVVQTNADNQDYYTQFKSSEYLGKILSQAVYSERFIDAVVETGKVNKEFLPFDKQDRLDAWKKMVSVQSNADLGMLHVVLKHDNQRTAENIMSALQTVMIDQNTLFRGGDQKSVEVRLLSGPITERNPNVKEIVTVTVIGFIAGIVFMAMYLFFRSGLYREESAFGIPRDMVGSRI